MNLRNGFGVLAIVCVPFLGGCGIGKLNFSGFDLQNLTFATVTVTPKPVSLAAGTSQTFTATTTNAGTAVVQWALDTPTAPGGVGTLSASSGDTITYTAPATPPIYSGPGLESTQGTVYITASVQPTNGSFFGSELVPIIITAPTISVGISPATVDVALGKQEQFSGYSVGSVNQGLTWQVNGVTGGSITYGTISQSAVWPFGGLYTAPATMPASGPTVAITVISQADPTKVQTATVTLQ